MAATICAAGPVLSGRCQSAQVLQPCSVTHPFRLATVSSRQSCWTLSRSQRSWQLAARGTQAIRAAAATAENKASVAAGEEFYEVTIKKPIGIRFARGNDSAAYIVKSDPKLGDTDEAIQVGDKVVRVSASFGNDTWEAKNFGQVMYAIKTRNGAIYLKLQKKYGDLTALQEEELSEMEKMAKTERAGGNYGAGTKELQQRNYIGRRELERKRRELFDDALQKYRNKQTEEALIDFENVLSLEPRKYIGDNFSRVTQIYRVTQYNIACCYSSLGNVDAGLEALESCLDAGFEDYGKIRSDSSLSALREDPRFKPLINRYDEPIINENAINALKSLFSFGKKSG